MTIKAHFDGKAFVPDEPVDVAVDQPAVVQLAAESGSPVVRTEEDLLKLFAEMDQDAVNPSHGVDYSRASNYDGNEEARR